MNKTDKQILTLLTERGSLTLSEIAEILEMKPKTVYRSLRRLFDKNYINNNAKTRQYMISEDSE